MSAYSGRDREQPQKPCQYSWSPA